MPAVPLSASDLDCLERQNLAELSALKGNTTSAHFVQSGQLQNSPLQIGSAVSLDGLQAAPHLNGTLGACEQFSPRSGRWKVRLVDGDVKALKAANLKPHRVDTVIFLDIDGVLHSLYGEDVFVESCCAQLSQLMRTTGARLVLSNQWAKEEGRMEIVNEVLQQRRLLPLYSQTIDLHSTPEAEICEWLDRHPDVQRWVVIDDTDMQVATSNHTRRLKGHTVRTDKHIGMTAEDVELAVRILRDPEFQPQSIPVKQRTSSAEDAHRIALSREAEMNTWNAIREGKLTS